MSHLGTFQTASVWSKIQRVEEDIHELLVGSRRFDIPVEPSRDVEILRVKFHPPKPSLSGKAGQVRLLHDLASIELQAMELGLRTLVEFREAPMLFREQLAEITLGEARHLRLCLEAIDSLGGKWGEWPVHTALWHAVAAEDSLLDRILIVHRYLEGSGLDAVDSILKRLRNVDSQIVSGVMKTILEEEVGHVLFGSEWYRKICALECIDPESDFSPRLTSIGVRLPRRMEVVSRELRKAAGFSPHEIEVLEKLRKDRIASRN